MHVRPHARARCIDVDLRLDLHVESEPCARPACRLADLKARQDILSVPRSSARTATDRRSDFLENYLNEDFAVLFYRCW